MGTLEIIIVLSALMALIALVTIGIDWIGKPLKNRRFIPRLYRFDDEKLPTDEYGNTQFGPSSPLGAAPGGPGLPVPGMPGVAVPPMNGPIMHAQPAPVVVAHVEVPARSNDTVRVPAAASHSAFSDTLARPAASAAATASAASSTIAGTTPAGGHMLAATSRQGWHTGMALDATIDDRKPNLATKAERFWRTTAEGLGDSHFDNADIERMRSGKAPRRKNPRSGKFETMLLTGLRQATQRSEVRMRWPDESVDPWNAQ